MKKPACLLTRRELLKGSAAAGGLAMLGTPTMLLGQQAGGSPFGSLAESFGNRLVTPGHDDYDNARSVCRSNSGISSFSSSSAAFSMSPCAIASPAA